MATRLYVKFESPEVEQRVISEVLGVSMDQWDRLARLEHDLRVASCAGDHDAMDKVFDTLRADWTLDTIHSYKLCGLGRVIPEAYDCAGIVEDEDCISGSVAGDVARKMLKVQAETFASRVGAWNVTDYWLCRLVRRPEVQGCYWC